MKDLVIEIVNDYLKSDLNNLRKCKDKNRKEEDFAILNYGKILGKVDLLPDICVIKYIRSYSAEEIGQALRIIVSAAEHIFLQRENSTPYLYENIIEALDEN